MTHRFFPLKIPITVYAGSGPNRSKPLQRLFDQCADFTLLVEGEGVSPDAAQEFFQSVPPGKLIRDKFLYGFLDRKGVIVGVLEGMRNYPDDKTWWVGLLLLVPTSPPAWLGPKDNGCLFGICACTPGHSHYARGGGREPGCLSFLAGIGVRVVASDQPRTFGRKIQKVYVMRRELTQKDLATQSS